MWWTRIYVAICLLGLIFFAAGPASAQKQSSDHRSSGHRSSDQRPTDQWRHLSLDEIAVVVDDRLRGDNSNNKIRDRRAMTRRLVKIARDESDIKARSQYFPYLIRIIPYMNSAQRRWLRSQIFKAIEANILFHHDRSSKDFYYAMRLTAALEALDVDQSKIQELSLIGNVILAQQDKLPPQMTLTDAISGQTHGYMQCYRRYHRYPAVPSVMIRLSNGSEVDWPSHLTLTPSLQ